MLPIQENSWDALTESAKAFANLILGEDQTDQLKESLVSYSQLQAENEHLKVEVASLRETLPFKDKYLNLEKEFRKVAAERDSLSSQALKANHRFNDYERLKSAYQKTKGDLAALEERLEKQRSSINQYSALECIYQTFKTSISRSCGVDIRRIPANLFLQLQLQDGSNRTFNVEFNRVAVDKWTRIQ